MQSRQWATIARSARTNHTAGDSPFNQDAPSKKWWPAPRKEDTTKGWRWTRAEFEGDHYRGQDEV